MREKLKGSEAQAVKLFVDMGVTAGCILTTPHYAFIFLLMAIFAATCYVTLAACADKRERRRVAQ